MFRRRPGTSEEISTACFGGNEQSCHWEACYFQVLEQVPGTTDKTGEETMTTLTKAALAFLALAGTAGTMAVASDDDFGDWRGGKSRLERADADDSGDVTFEEFTAAMKRRIGGADADGDGKMTVAEIAFGNRAHASGAHGAQDRRTLRHGWRWRAHSRRRLNRGRRRCLRSSTATTTARSSRKRCLAAGMIAAAATGISSLSLNWIEQVQFLCKASGCRLDLFLRLGRQLAGWDADRHDRTDAMPSSGS